MKAVHFDSEGREIDAHQARGVAGFISWRRLAEVLRKGGELREGETLASYQLDERGLTFRVKTS